MSRKIINSIVSRSPWYIYIYVHGYSKLPHPTKYTYVLMRIQYDTKIKKYVCNSPEKNKAVGDVIFSDKVKFETRIERVQKKPHLIFKIV